MYYSLECQEVFHPEGPSFAAEVTAAWEMQVKLVDSS